MDQFFKIVNSSKASLTQHTYIPNISSRFDRITYDDQPINELTHDIASIKIDTIDPIFYRYLLDCNYNIIGDDQIVNMP